LGIFGEKKLKNKFAVSFFIIFVLYIPTRGNLFLPVRLLVWADGRGTVEQADSAARAELQRAAKQKLLQLKNIQKYHWVKHREMLISCLDVCPDI
jgi:hypothetical protein